MLARHASPLPLNGLINDRDEISKNRNQAPGSYYYSSTDYGGSNVGKVESMAGATSVSFSSQQDFGGADYSPVTTLPEDYESDFESEKIIKPNEKIVGKNNATSTADVIAHQISDFGQTINNNNTTIQDQQQPSSSSTTGSNNNNNENSNNNNNNNNQGKFSKLLFSSPSATVESNGPSGPFKAIICHDCENSEGRNVGHSVSFSAIKSWNVGGKSKVATVQLEADSNRTTSITTTLVKETIPHPQHPVQQQQQQQPAPTLMLPSSSSDEKYLDENEQIDQHDNVELFKVTNSANNNNNNNNNAVTEKPKLPTRSWNFSSSWHLGTNTNSNNNHNVAHRKPIFTDLLKVPYDVLNAPLTEPPSTTSTSTTTTAPPPQEQSSINQQSSTIHIKHQQKFNDTITSNYQHFQQFIHKNLNSNPPQAQHYQSTAMPEQNYEVDESVSLMTNGRVHGVQTTSSRIPVQNENQNVNHHHLHHQQQQHQYQQQGGTANGGGEDDQEQDAKFGYVVEGRNFRKYRVEEKTADGFIVG